MMSSQTRPRRAFLVEFAIVVLLAGIAFSLTLMHTRELGNTIAQPELDSGWFQADTDDFYPMMLSRWVGQGETRIHPLFSLAVSAPAIGLRQHFGLTALEAFQMVYAASAALWIIAWFALLRVMGCRRLDAFVFGILGLMSGAAMFWFAVPESYPFGSITLLLVLIVAALCGRKAVQGKWFMLASAASLSMTVTNWMAGIILAFTRFPWRRALQITVNAFCLVVVLWGAQKAIFPRSSFFLETGRIIELKTRFLFHPHAGGPLRITRSFFLHSMVVPEIIQRPDAGDSLRMVTQRSLPGSGGPLAPAALALWVVLLGLGIWGVFSTPGLQWPLKKVVGLTLLGQLALHLVYGDETFLYALHFIPLLLTIAAFSLLSRFRLLGLSLAMALAVSAGIHNHGQFQKAANRMHHYDRALLQRVQTP